MRKGVVIISVISRGDSLGDNIKNVLINEGIEDVVLVPSLKVKENGLRNIVSEHFKDKEGIVFLSSTGIAVRGIHGFVNSKKVDPAVVVVDTGGKYAISLLSGHLGGANRLTEIIAEGIGAESIITTATDGMGIKAPDMIAKENGLYIESMKECKKIAALLVNGRKVNFFDKAQVIERPKGYVNELHAHGIVTVDVEEDYPQYETHLKLFRKNIILGIGCRKDYSSEKMSVKVNEKLKELEIDKNRIGSIASIHLKKDEKAIRDLAVELGVPFITYSVEELQKVHHKYGGSDFVENITGVRAVAEPAVELAGGEVVFPKEKMEGMTLAIGKVKS